MQQRVGNVWGTCGLQKMRPACDMGLSSCSAWVVLLFSVSTQCLSKFPHSEVLRDAAAYMAVLFLPKAKGGLCDFAACGAQQLRETIIRWWGPLILERWHQPVPKGDGNSSQSSNCDICGKDKTIIPFGGLGAIDYTIQASFTICWGFYSLPTCNKEREAW